MSSLPLISHHLFVAAIRNQDEDRGRRRRDREQDGGQTDCARAISMEIMGDVKAAASHQPRAFEAAFAPGEG
jgi:hypothetical protein